MTEQISEAVFRKFLLSMQTSGVDIKELKEQVDGLVSSAKHMNSLIEELRKENTSLLTENKQLNAENQSLSLKIGGLKQYSRLSDVEIKGVPRTQGLGCVAILEEIGEKVACPITPADLDIVHRVRIQINDQKNIIARFFYRVKKADFVSNSRTAKLSLSDIGILGTASSSPLFVNDHLTPANKSLLSKALKLEKEKDWMFVWTENCQIKARKTTSSSVLRIRSESDLTKKELDATFYWSISSTANNHGFSFSNK